jgi:3-isopropylmalate/(R)-2-methylmalate dehydratase large subunit
MSDALTYFAKVWSDHVIKDLGDGAALLQIDRLVQHEWGAARIVDQFLSGGRRVAQPELVFMMVDHLIDTAPGRGPNQSHAPFGAETIEKARRGLNALGLRFFDVGDPRQGIVHIVAPELGIALPGATLVCGDSHTCTDGGVGALAWGISTSELAHALATQTLPQVKPKTMRVTFDGAVPQGIHAKDMILSLIGAIGAQGGIGYAVEFAGPAIRSLPVEGRLTLCNMGIEFSARYAFVPPDDTTLQYLHGRDFAPAGALWDRAVAYWQSLLTAPEASFDREVTLDCAAMQPQVTWGTSPGHVIAVDGVVPDPADASDADARAAIERALSYVRLVPGTPIAGVPIEAAFIGSCTNSRLSDLRDAADVLRGRKIAPGIQAVCVPGSSAVKAAAEAEGLDRIFREAGFEWHEAGCSLCADMGNKRLADRRVISTSNRNFEGRQGPQTRTHLASPATVAASAVAGRIADHRRLAS